MGIGCAAKRATLSSSARLCDEAVVVEVNARMCCAQHVSAKSLEVPKQSVPVGSLLYCDLNFRVLLELPCAPVQRDAPAQPSRGRWSGNAAPISNNEPEDGRRINIRSSQPATASPSRPCSEMTLSIGVNWTPAPGFQTHSTPGLIKSRRYN